MITVITEN